MRIITNKTIRKIVDKLFDLKGGMNKFYMNTEINFHNSRKNILLLVTFIASIPQ